MTIVEGGNSGGTKVGGTIVGVSFGHWSLVVIHRVMKTEWHIGIWPFQ